MNSKGPINNFVCKSLRNIRIGKGVKVLDVARRTRIPASSYSCLEWGRYKLNLDNLFRILHALDADITEVWPMAASTAGRSVDGEQIKQVLAASEQMRPPQPSVEEFVDVVCSACGIDCMDREVARTSKKVRECQVIAAIIVRDLPYITLTALSHALDVNISSLSHRTRRLLRQAETDDDLGRRIESVRREVLEVLPTSSFAKAS